MDELNDFYGCFVGKIVLTEPINDDCLEMFRLETVDAIFVRRIW